MEAHRANPACAGCHKVMDPMGFALENFDGIGAWLDRSEAGVLIDLRRSPGRRLESRRARTALRNDLLARSQVFVGTLTEKLLTYALGRGVEYYDNARRPQILSATPLPTIPVSPP